MTTLHDIRAGKPLFYPDQAIHAEYACRQSGLAFDEIDGGTGLIFTVGSGDRRAAFGAGRGSFYPQNTATAATLANDKYIANVLMARAAIANLGGQYFFLHERHSARRPAGHERTDALAYLQTLGGSAFIKPLAGSRGDFAQPVPSAEALNAYLEEVACYYDAVILQARVSGLEYRIFVLDGEIVYCARKAPPVVTGDGRRTIGELRDQSTAQLRQHGVSSAQTLASAADDECVPAGETRPLPGRMNRSAGGTMVFAVPDRAEQAYAVARGAVAALGLRAGAVDLFTDVGGDPTDMRVIEVNANPSIRFLEDSGRPDLILRIWRHGFAALGLYDV